MTKFEVLLCTYYYLEKEYFSDKNKSNEYIYYVCSVNPDIWRQDEGTADPAYYAEYLEICSSFFSDSVCSLQEGFDYAKNTWKNIMNMSTPNFHQILMKW